MTAILLDTTAFLWLVSTPDRIATSARQQLEATSNELFVSAASAWEIAIKTRLGRLEGNALLSSWGKILESMYATDLPIDSADAVMAGQLSWDHKDPFDRMIVAQAARRGLAIATSDKALQHGAVTPLIATR
ncbi:type II toxin-antitoxin system VapC family toxin [Antrihabitans sp. YC3-6]|uniref:Type II toxin-antitoxin system VapC family toxin n=1 Tax=Antrihabitans stalagmiti TaxID=2799499 RepID=A0A934NVL3_9NOCA|nr:type II toxin-antitoxin system VapC family toxin [Antrihabitans stalagmiti]MBJ8342037.1 type II toxin-antitoxin system VapC family toxin [Antrihabitans stalagmiti]